MLAVIGLMGVAGVATLAIAASTMNSIGVSSAARAAVQSQAAAEAGVDAALGNLSQPTCKEQWGTTTPISTVDVFYSLDPTPVAGEPDENWFPGCPAANAERVKIISTGEATQNGQAGNNTGDSRIVEAIYAVNAKGSGKAAGIAIYADSDFSVIESVTIHADESSIIVRNGDASCISSGANVVDVLLYKGDLTLGESCGVFGNVWVSGKISISGSAAVHGTAVADAKPEFVDPGWYDLKYKYSKTNGAGPTKVKSQKDQAAWAYFENVVSIEGTCTLTALQLAADDLAGAPGIIECADGVDVSTDGTLIISSDIAIVADSFQFRETAQIDAAAKQKLWLVTSDKSPNNKAKCNAKAGDFSVIESVKVNVNVDVMVYTPCNVNISTSSQWRGQIWGGTVKLGTSGVYTYAEVGFPGPTSGGSEATDLGTSPLGARQSIRDLNG
ncbi:hypothetical protein E3T35_11925 [Cryobacterium sp. TMT1-2-2]|uniref:hypothetical protein n=1 Tax=Cryobacterium sp. TMT1-2-2 TaxID=1259233 RepID=UPI0010699589|nr:hypothetical protein [Cryobacterium sp. TMT1-2-2]TFD11258.1 hypothetical protein E3T35_11925 [Cryobacterium sp. TMT1-2-2]